MRILIIIFVIFSTGLKGQYPSKIWYFGTNLGIDFNFTPPKSLINKNIDQSESTCTVTDEFGSLLFYSDKSNVYNWKHKIMKNGSGLLGNNGSSAQSPIAIQKPSDPTKFYIFYTADEQLNQYKGNFRYSIIDLCGDNGLGEVLSVSKNKQIPGLFSERLNVVPLLGGNAYWIICSKLFSSEINTYYLDKNGLNINPIISTIPVARPPQIGVIVPNKQRNKILFTGCLDAQDNGIWLMYFDTISGKISNTLPLQINLHVYDAIFSQNDEFIYYTSCYYPSGVYQFEISKQKITTLLSVQDKYYVGSIQRGPNNVIYIADVGKSSLSCVLSPDKSGFSCNFVENYFKTSSNGKNTLGLQNDEYNYGIIKSIKASNFLGNDTSLCMPFLIELVSPNDCTIWSDGTIKSKLIVNSNGTYFASYRQCDQLITDTIVISTIINLPKFLPKDTILCEGESILLFSPNDSTIWSNGTISKTLLLTASGVYWAEIKSPCGIIRDSINVKFIPKLKLDLGENIQICPNNYDTIWSISPNTIWHDGSIGKYYVTNKEELVIGTIINQCGESSDTVLVSFFSNTFLNLGNDTVICEGSFLNLTSNSDNTIWFDNSIGRIKQIFSAGTYWASQNSICGLQTDTIRIDELKTFPLPYLPKDTILCQGIKLTLSIPLVNEIWNNNFINMITIQTPGKYWYNFKDICNNFNDTIQIYYDSIPNSFPSNKLVLCENEKFYFRTGYSNTEWSDGSIGPEIYFNKSGIIEYHISNTCGIFKSSLELEFKKDLDSYIPNVFSPNGDQVNDVFPGTYITEGFELEIYDRWGSQIFKSNNTQWKGTFKSQDVPPGVYAYIIKSKICNQNIKYGNVTLVR